MRNSIHIRATFLWLRLLLGILALASSPVKALANDYCSLVLRAEVVIAAAVGERDQLKATWAPLANELARIPPQSPDLDAHKNLMIALRAGSLDMAFAALRDLRQSYTSCFGPNGNNSLDTGGDGDALYGAGNKNDSGIFASAAQFISEHPVAAVGATSAISIILGVIGALILASRRRSLWRRAPRFACLVPASISAPKSMGQGSLVNINAFGAQVQRAEVEAEIGDSILLETPVFSASAKAMWVNSHFLGLRFDKPIEDTDVEKAIHFATQNFVFSNANDEPEPEIKFTSLRQKTAG